MSIEDRIARLLALGVRVAAVAMAAGWLLLLASPRTAVNPEAPAGMGQMVAGLLAGEPLAVMTAGLVVLILSPILRVAAAGLHFARQRDYPLALAALVVLVILAVGVLSGQAE